MLTGIQYSASPSSEQAQVLSQWIGCGRVIWNAKCSEDRYLRTFARKYLPVGTYTQPDKTYSQYKTELTPWLKDCPSQILRNSATIWANTYRKFFKKECGRPVKKNRLKGNYIWLTRELFELKRAGKRYELHIGTKSKSLGVLKLDWHKVPRHDQLPNSIWIKVKNGNWTASFSYDDGQLEDDLLSAEDHLKHLKTCEREQLEKIITPIDRGVARPVQTHNKTYTLDAKILSRQKAREAYIKRHQRKLARQKKGSNRSKKTKGRIARAHGKTANVRADFLHKTSRSIVNESNVIVMENLNLKGMTKRAKPVFCDKTQKWLKNNGAAKSGLNKALLGVGLYKFEEFINYKAYKENKPVFKVSPVNTSRECAACGYTHPENRQSQSVFSCKKCGHTDNADHNAAIVIRKRAIDLILDSGTELVGTKKNVLRLRASDNSCKTREARATHAASCSSKKKAA